MRIITTDRMVVDEAGRENTSRGSAKVERTMSEGIAIVGVGETEYVRSSPKSVSALAVEAVLNAAADAGIPARAIDGVIPIGGQVTADDVMSALALPGHFVATSPLGGAAAVADLQLAELAIAGGAASCVVVVLAHKAASQAPISQRVNSLPGQVLKRELETPFGWETPAQWYAMICRRHMYECGTTKAHLASVALTMRAHAQLNPRAMMFGRPMTAEDYAASPMLADPYQKFDFSLETDGAAAVIIAADEAVGQLRAPRIRVKGASVGRPNSPDDLTNRTDWLTIGLTSASRDVYERAAVGPEDCDAAMIYDCFTFELLHQMEEAAFFPRGDAGPRIAAGEITLEGRLPVNTHGGLLSEGHLGGLNHVIEAVRQLRGTCAERQIKGARHIAVTGWGGLGDGSMAILTNQN
jgi:acetyl-CoA acetyltransferase